MRYSILLPIGLLLLSGAEPVGAQLLSEQTDGRYRVCVYAGTANVTSESAPRTYRIGIGQNCPLTYPALDEGTSPPPTAELRSERLTERGRDCIYGQGAATWPVALPSSQPCPLFAGMAESTATSSLTDNSGGLSPDR